MTADILTFERPAPVRRAWGTPTAEPQSCAASSLPAGRRDYSLRDMTRLLKMGGSDRRTAISALRKLADQCGMPLPKTPRIYRQRVQTGSDAIFAGSIWCALEVDAWMDQGPAGTTAKPAETERAAAAPASTRGAMRERAIAMRAGGRS